jgi:hypothetical protein
MSATNCGNSTINILSLDDEYLIALDAQFVLSDRPWCHVEPAVTHTMEQLLNEPGRKFDIVLLDPQSRGLDLDAALLMCEAHGATMIFSTVEPDLEERRAYASVPQVLKPYVEIQLLRAITIALMPSQPEMARAVIAEIEASGP